MATLGDLRTRIADELLKRNLATQIAQHVARAVEFYAGRRFWFNTGRMVGAPTAADGDGYVALPTGTRLIDEIRIGNIILEPREPAVIDDWLANSPATAPEPYDYAVSGDRIRLYPTPSAPVSIVVVGTFDVLPLITATADASVSNAWTNEASDLIAGRARMTLCRDVLRDPEGMGLAKAAEQEAEFDLNMKTIRRIGRGRVRGYL